MTAKIIGRGQNLFWTYTLGADIDTRVSHWGAAPHMSPNHPATETLTSYEGLGMEQVMLPIYINRSHACLRFIFFSLTGASLSLRLVSSSEPKSVRHVGRFQHRMGRAGGMDREGPVSFVPFPGRARTTSAIVTPAPRLSCRSKRRHDWCCRIHHTNIGFGNPLTIYCRKYSRIVLPYWRDKHFL